MDSALQRRNKTKQVNASNIMTDSEKISLQVNIDVKIFAEEVKALLEEDTTRVLNLHSLIEAAELGSQ